MSQFRSLKNDCFFWEPDASRFSRCDPKSRCSFRSFGSFPVQGASFSPLVSSRYFGLDRAIETRRRHWPLKSKDVVVAEPRGGLPLPQEDLEPRPWLRPAPQRGSRTKKVRLGCHQIHDQAWGRPLALPENQRKSLPKPLRPLNDTKDPCGLGLHF